MKILLQMQEELLIFGSTVLPDTIKGQTSGCGYYSYTGKVNEFRNIQNVSSPKYSGGVVGCGRDTSVSLFVGRIDLEKTEICETQNMPSDNRKELTVQTVVLYYHMPAYRSDGMTQEF